MPHSHHSHSGQFCRHAKDTLEQVVHEAKRKGFVVFGLSEHTPRYREEDLFPEESDLTPDDLVEAYESFLREAQRLRDAERASQSALSLLIGIECDYISSLDLDGLERLLGAHPEIDYVVGSVHHVEGISIDFDRPTWLRAVRHFDVSGQKPGKPGQTMQRTASGRLELVPVDETEPRLAPGYVPSASELAPFLRAYLDAQYEMLQRHQPEVVGHFDLCLLWTPRLSLSAFPDLWERVRRNVDYAVGYGALFEANAAAIRKGWNGSYPSPDVLKYILSRGGRICLSDDSHGVGYVGLNYAKMRQYLLDNGVQHVWCLVPAAEQIPGDAPVGKRHRVVARKHEAWSTDPFWATLEKATAAP